MTQEVAHGMYRRSTMVWITNTLHITAHEGRNEQRREREGGRGSSEYTGGAGCGSYGSAR
eukprot:1540328-Pleurochrysis_carterae.AAC.1